MKTSKRRRAIAEQVDKTKRFPISEALVLLKKMPELKFIETVDVSVKLGVDPKKSDQNVRAAVVLPHGTGKSVRVAVFTNPGNVQAAKDAGADAVGLEDLLAQFQAGNIDYDVVIASPDAMGIVGRLGQVLGPRGLMPNPKVGTVTPDVVTAVKNAKAGQVRYKTDKGGLVHCAVGKKNFEPQQLKENIETFISDLKKRRPQSAKGVFIQKLTVSTTMGPGLTVDLASLEEK